ARRTRAEVLGLVDEPGCQADVRDLVEERLEGARGDHPGGRGAWAAVSTAPEGEMARDPSPGELEALPAREQRLVAVCGGDAEDYLIAGLDRDARELGLPHAGPGRELPRRVVTKRLV